MKISVSFPSLVSLPLSPPPLLSLLFCLSPLPLTLSPFLFLSEVSLYSPGWYRSHELVVTLLIQSTDGIANTHHLAPDPWSSLLIPH